MQVRIEIDVKPEELRRFLGLPDVGGLQDDVIEFLREKVETAGDFDAAAFLRGNLDTLRKYPAVKRLLAAAKVTLEEEKKVVKAATSKSAGPRRPRTTSADKRK